MTTAKKRITVKYMSPNPLFEEWLTKWRDDAIEKGSKMQYCFSTALQSIKRYPLPLESAKECKILKGFGDKLCIMLDQKLKQHRSADKNIAQDADKNTMDSEMTNPEKDTNIDGNKTSKLKQNRKTRVSKAKTSEEYVPQHGSGGYAILLTLLLKSQEADYKGFTLKAEIIKQAKALSNKSFTKSDPGSFYTAWSSMQTLISKGLVVKWSNPAKFKLTDQGVALAISLQKETNSNSDTNDNICLRSIGGTKEQFNVKTTSNSNSNNDIMEIMDDYDTIDADFFKDVIATNNGGRIDSLDFYKVEYDKNVEKSAKNSNTATENSHQHLINHKSLDQLDEDYFEVISKYSSQEEIAAQETLLSQYSLDTNPSKSNKDGLSNNTKEDKTAISKNYSGEPVSELDKEFLKLAAKYAKSKSDNLSTLTNDFSSKSTLTNNNLNKTATKDFNMIDDYADDVDGDNLQPRHTATSSNIIKDNKLKTVMPELNKRDTNSASTKTLKRTLSEPHTKLTNKKSTKPKLGKFPSESFQESQTSENSKDLQKGLKSFKSDASENSGTLESECFLMGPESFDVILLVDNQENSDSKNEEIQDGLKLQSIKFETRDLKVGDYAWICRCRMTEKELILPYVVERKRMDDLGCSIKDGRYYEQKFRLQKCGIENLTYLVESHGNNSSVGLPLTSLYQAATNTALQDNFFIKFTNNIKETTQYLISFSRSLIKLYKGKTLVSCPRDEIKPVDLNDDLVCLMEFKQFNKSSIKNQKLKVSDMFVKVLIQIKGMSVEKAIVITEKYSSLLDLYEEYEKIPANEQEKLLCDIKYGKTGKTVGAVLSKTVYQFFTRNSY